MRYLIWSGEHGAYWRPPANGYTTDPTEAAVYTEDQARRYTSHCGPEKMIRLIPLRWYEVALLRLAGWMGRTGERLMQSARLPN